MNAGAELVFSGAAGADPSLETAFAASSTIGAPAAARLVGMDIKTLQRHVAAGHLVGRIKGLGLARRHRVFTRADVLHFLQLLTEVAPCPSIAENARRSGNLISKSVVIDFPARPNSRTNMTRRPSKKTKK